MNKKIFIPVLIAAIMLPMTAFVMYSDSSEVVLNDGKMTTVIDGLSGGSTPLQKAEMAELILLGDIQSVNLVEEKDHPDSRFILVMSYVEIKPTEILKGTPVLNSNGNVLLRLPGGETDSYRTITEDLVFSENEHVFLYLAMNKEETSTYIPVSSETMFVIRDGQAKDNLDNLTDLDELVKKHKDIIKELP